jgi:hypothetical protein
MHFVGFISSFWTYVRKILKYQTQWKSVQWEPICCMWTDGRTDGRTDMTKLNVAFRNIANAPRNKTFRSSTGLLDTTQALYLYRAQIWENPQWMLALCISTLHTPCDHYAHVSIQQCYKQSVQPFLHSHRQTSDRAFTDSYLWAIKPFGVNCIVFISKQKAFTCTYTLVIS